MIFLVSSTALTGTPESIAVSARTVDIEAATLASDYDTQIKAKMLSAIIIFPNHSNPIGKDKRLGAMANFLAAFKSKEDEAQKVSKYLQGNGIVRILWLEYPKEGYMLNSYAQSAARDLLEERPEQDSIRECRKAEAEGKAIAYLDAIGAFNNHFVEPAESVSNIAEMLFDLIESEKIPHVKFEVKNEIK